MRLQRLVSALTLVAVVNGDGEADQDPSCPYIIATQAEADARRRDASIPGNVVDVENLFYGRSGNHFVTLSENLRLGFCCKSKLVSLPKKDATLAPGIFSEGKPGPRNFDFSSAPDVEGFNATSCPSNIAWSGKDAYLLTELSDEAHPYDTPGLLECVKTVPSVVECEAAYLFPQDIDLCRSDTTGREAYKRIENGSDESKVRLDLGRAEYAEEGAGNLVMHVRSGDIFVSPVPWAYGQPPLQYYLRAIEDQMWARVDVVTNGDVDYRHALNPIVPALEAMVASGELQSNVHIHKNRSMEEDLLSMICADGLVTSRSSLTRLLEHHTLASRIYFPGECTKRLCRETARPGRKVFGTSASLSEDYSPFLHWRNTGDQLAEMIAFNVTGFQQCNASTAAAASGVHCIAC